MIYKKPPSMKYTDMCIFIDQNVPNIINPGENPDLENKIYRSEEHTSELQSQ